MLPTRHRLRDSSAFALASRKGRRAARPTLVVHYLPATDPDVSPAKVGFVVGRSVGGSVVRSRVSRRLRHLTRDVLDVVPEGSILVIRALPAAAQASSAVLGDDLRAAMSRAVRR